MVQSFNYHSNLFPGKQKSMKVEQSMRSRQWHIALRELLMERFDADDLTILCFDFDCNYEDLPGEAKSRKVIELIQLAARSDRICELIEACRRMRPALDWDSIRHGAINNPRIFQVDEKASGEHLRIVHSQKCRRLWLCLLKQLLFAMLLIASLLQVVEVNVHPGQPVCIKASLPLKVDIHILKIGEFEETVCLPPS